MPQRTAFTEFADAGFIHAEFIHAEFTHAEFTNRAGGTRWDSSEAELSARGAGPQCG